MHALADVVCACYWAMVGPDDAAQHLRMARELAQLARDAGDLRLQANGHASAMGHLLEQGDLDGSMRELDRLEQLAKARHDRYTRWLVGVIRAMHAHRQGQLAAAESFALEAIGQWEDRPPFATPVQVFGAQMMLLRREQGRLHELAEPVAAVVSHTPDMPVWRCLLANTYAQIGDRDRAELELKRLGDLSVLPRDAFWLLAVTTVAAAASAVNDLGLCRRAYELLVPYTNTVTVAAIVLCEGSASRPLGMLATTLGHYDEAELYFKRALRMNAQIKSPLWIAHTQRHYAHMLLLRNHRNDHDKALKLLNQALVTATELGLDALADNIMLKLPADAGDATRGDVQA